MILVVKATCNDPGLAGILNITKNILLIIQIVVPILLIFFSSYEITKLVMNPEAKGGTKKVINKFIAAVIVFFIPVLINATLGLVGEKTNFSSCWNNAKQIVGTSKYIPPNTDNKKSKKTINNGKYDSSKK